jgi:hypothetical protein
MPDFKMPDIKIIGGAVVALIAVVIVLLYFFAPGLLGISPAAPAADTTTPAASTTPASSTTPAASTNSAADVAPSTDAAPAAPAAPAEPAAAPPTSSSFTDQTNIINTSPTRISTFAIPLTPGVYTKGNITFTIADQNFGNANAIGNIVVRDKTTKTVIIFTKKSFPASDRPSKTVSVDLTGTYVITGNEEVVVSGSELYGGYRLNITNGSVTFSN